MGNIFEKRRLDFLKLKDIKLKLRLDITINLVDITIMYNSLTLIFHNS